MMSIFQHSKSDVEKIDFEGFSLYKSVFKYINSNMYVLLENAKALVIDPNPNDYVISFLKDNNVKYVDILLTHEHRDHVYGIYLFQENFKTNIICTKYCGDYISKIENARPIVISYMLEEYDIKNGTSVLNDFNKEYVPRVYEANITFDKNYVLNWESHSLEFFNILGHSAGSCVIIVDGKCAFTGDTLLKIYPVITRLPGGNKKIYKNETLPLLEQKLKPDMWILPGHGDTFQLKEIMKDGKINVEIR